MDTRPWLTLDTVFPNYHLSAMKVLAYFTGGERGRYGGAMS